MTTLDIVIPVYNEAHTIETCVASLRAFVSDHLPHYETRIVTANNGSTDDTLAAAQALAQRHDNVGYVHLDLKGRGRSLKKAWSESNADVVAYMDVDLSTDLSALPPLVDAIASGGYDIAIGSRLLPESKVERSLKREVLSRGYNLIIRSMFLTGFHDAQCGFKAVSRRVVQELAPVVKDNHWFFDTELLIIAEKRGYRLKEIPVTWSEDPDSRVKIASTVAEDLKGLLRLRVGGIPQPVQAHPKEASS